AAGGAAVGDGPVDGGAEIVAAHDERVRAEEVAPSARNRACRHPEEHARHVEYAARLGGERRIATGAELGNCVVPPLLVMTVALPAVLELVKVVKPRELVVMVAFPAVLEPANDVLPPRLAVMVALPALLVLLKVVDPRKLAVRVALPAVLDPRKLAKPPLPLGRGAVPAVLGSLTLSE